MPEKAPEGSLPEEIDRVKKLRAAQVELIDLSDVDVGPLLQRVDWDVVQPDADVEKIAVCPCFGCGADFRVGRKPDPPDDDDDDESAPSVEGPLVMTSAGRVIGGHQQICHWAAPRQEPRRSSPTAGGQRRGGR